jgi:hypothetical protein
MDPVTTSSADTRRPLLRSSRLCSTDYGKANMEGEGGPAFQFYSNCGLFCKICTTVKIYSYSLPCLERPNDYPLVYLLCPKLTAGLM